MLQRTPALLGERKYQVFISSTFRDLYPERKKAVEVVVERGHIPIDLSLFSARSQSDVQVIQQAIRQCQIYVVILGHRYGSIVTNPAMLSLLDDPSVSADTIMSYTEFEYRLAEKHKLVMLPFVLRDELITERRAALSPRDTEDDKELAHHERLQQFHRRVSQSLFYKPFGNDDDFKCLVLASLVDAVTDCTKPGWIPEPEQPEQQALIRSVSGNPFILDIVGRLSGFDSLDTRCKREPDRKMAAARFFSNTYHTAICHHHVSLFFESGSTVAYVVQAMAAGLRAHMNINDSGQPSIEISTNNVLAYQLLWLCHRIPITLFPWGAPETRYGATFGSLEEMEDRDPDYRQPCLDESEVHEIEKLKTARFSITAMRQPALLLGAISGLQLSPNHATEPTPIKDNVREQIQKCFGLHVGSYKNKLFKRFMIDTGMPTMIFMESKKVDCPIAVGKCHFILDRGLTWDAFRKEHPLAFCVGCRQTEMDERIGQFVNMGFEVMRGNEFAEFSAFIARNPPFIDRLERPLGFVPSGIVR